MAKSLGKLSQFNPQSQAVGKVGGSKPTPQAALLKRGGSSKGSYPAHPQKIRG